MTSLPELLDAPTSCGVEGRRERKKAATRQAIGEAALRLALERGLDNVRVVDIADAAGVAPRTYNNYFSSREEAICAIGAERARRIVERFEARPRNEPLAEALAAAFTWPDEHEEPDRAALRLIFCDPALRGEHLKALVALEQPLTEAIASRLGLEANGAVGPRVLAAACTGALRAATTAWLRDDAARSLRALVVESFAALAPSALELERRSREVGGQAASRDEEAGHPCS